MPSDVQGVRSPELKSQGSASCLICVLGTELWFSIRKQYVLLPAETSLQPQVIILLYGESEGEDMRELNIHLSKPENCG